MSNITEAVRSLADHLLSKGIIHSGIGHRPPSEREIIVYLRRSRDKFVIPREWEGHPVETYYAGKVKPA